jgi:hypothetical protein
MDSLVQLHRTKRQVPPVYIRARTTEAVLHRPSRRPDKEESFVEHIIYLGRVQMAIRQAQLFGD